jgi:hypothetical protein
MQLVRRRILCRLHYGFAVKINRARPNPSRGFA